LLMALQRHLSGAVQCPLFAPLSDISAWPPYVAD
jgi:hypothetical protein